jgi:hypothetical protein
MSNGEVDTIELLNDYIDFMVERGVRRLKCGSVELDLWEPERKVSMPTQMDQEEPYADTPMYDDPMLYGSTDPSVIKHRPKPPRPR